MANILDIAKDFNPKVAFKNIFNKFTELIEQTNTNTTAISAIGTVPKVYKALLTQSGTNAPVPTVLVNTLSGTPTYSYIGEGAYGLQLTNEFPLSKTIIKFGNELNTDVYLLAFKVDASNITIFVGNLALIGNGINSILSNTSITIEVYP